MAIPLPRMAVPIVPLVVATALFMQNMDMTILSTALPAIATDLNVDPLALKLAVTSYLVGLAIFIPASGWVADRFGASTTFRAALLIFALTSIGCALSTSLSSFVVFRFLQGAGGAMMVPVGRLVIVRTVPKAELVRALAVLTMPALIGPILGPPLGGLIVTVAHWRWIFVINVPVALLGIWLATLYIPNERSAPEPFDMKGFVMAGLGLSGILLGAAMTGRHVAPPLVAALVFAVGVIGLAGYVHHALRAERPLLDLRLFRIPTFSAGVAAGIPYRIGSSAANFLLPLMLQLLFGLSALQSGLLTFAGACGAFLAKPFIVTGLKRVGFRRVLIINTFLNSILLAVLALFDALTPHIFIFLVLMISGVTRSIQFTSMGALSYADIEDKDSASATSLSNVGQQLGQSLGVAVGAMALEVASLFNGHDTPQLIDFSIAFVAMALISMSPVFQFVNLREDAGHVVSGHRQSEQRK
jgi:EmrB/QacA subfamily drug resistance transporter